MSLKTLMGTSYEGLPTVPAAALPPVTYREVPLDEPAPELAREEHIISSLKRASLVSDAPVLHATDP
jgi:hypothetical protein